MKKLLLIVDPQVDFMYGTLPVQDAIAKIDNLANQYLPKSDYDHVLVTLDWHPYNHCSFTENGGPWPKHCVEFTDGAAIYPPLNDRLDRTKLTIVTKGTTVNEENYSVFEVSSIGTRMFYFVSLFERIDVCGIVGTVCVQNTIKGLLEVKEKLNVLLPYTAQFSKEDEEEFIKWLDENGVKWSR